MLERFTRGEPDPMVGVCLPWVFVPLSAPFFSIFGALFSQIRDDFWFQFWVRFLVPILGTALFSFLLRFPKWEPKNGPKTGTANFGFGPGIFGNWVRRWRLGSGGITRRAVAWKVKGAHVCALFLHVSRSVWVPSVERARSNLDQRSARLRLAAYRARRPAQDLELLRRRRAPFLRRRFRG